MDDPDARPPFPTGRAVYNSRMTIDIHQIPIPDWSLVCPRCAYPLRGLPSHRCPECGATLDMSKLVKPWTRLRSPDFTGQELPIPDFGLDCPVCGTALAGAAAHRCVQCGVEVRMEAFRPRSRWFEADTWTGGEPATGQIEMLLQSRHIPHVRSPSRSTTDVFLARGTAGGVLYVLSEFFFDFMDVLRQERHARRSAAFAAAWNCRSCGELVPGHFEICWNCESNRGCTLQSEAPGEKTTR